MKLGPRREEPYFHVGESLGVNLLSEVSFRLGLVLVGLSWEEGFELFAKNDHGWAESVERVRSGAVLPEGSTNWSVSRVHWGPKLPVTSLLGCIDC